MKTATDFPLTARRRAVLEALIAGRPVDAALVAPLRDAGLVTFSVERGNRWLLTVEGRRRLEKAQERVAAANKRQPRHVSSFDDGPEDAELAAMERRHD